MKEKNRNIKNENKKPPVFILMLLIFMITILILIYNISLRFEPYTIIQYEGYAVSGKDLVSALLDPNLNAEPTIEALKIREDEAVYKKIASYFIGEEKKVKINLDYPIYINNNMAILNLSDNSKLITTKFQEIEGYENSTLTSGTLYNSSDLERADYNDYLFLKNSDNMFINSKIIKIKTAANDYEIPVNSIINIEEDSIRYYHLENEAFKYETIIDIEKNSTISIETIDFSIDTSSNTPQSNIQMQEYSYKDFLLSLKIIKLDEETLKDEVDKEIDNKKDTYVEDKNATSSEDEIKPDDEKLEENKDSENTAGQGGEAYWREPTSTVEGVNTNTYTANILFKIDDPSNTIKTAITFEIYKNDKIYLRKETYSLSNLDIKDLEPNTEYKIKGKYKYIDRDKNVQEVIFLEENIKTKGISELTPISLSFKNGDIYTSKIEIKNLKIDSNLEDVKETIVGTKKAVILINGEAYNISTSNLKDILARK